MEGQQQQQEYDTSENKHLLNSKWVVWYHNPSDKSWERDSYKDILELSSLEDFFVLKNSWETCLPTVSEGMFFVMRKLKNNNLSTMGRY